jgi:hypothetical protein
MWNSRASVRIESHSTKLCPENNIFPMEMPPAVEHGFADFAAITNGSKRYGANFCSDEVVLYNLYCFGVFREIPFRSASYLLNCPCAVGRFESNSSAVSPANDVFQQIVFEFEVFTVFSPVACVSKFNI